MAWSQRRGLATWAKHTGSPERSEPVRCSSTPTVRAGVSSSHSEDSRRADTAGRRVTKLCTNTLRSRPSPSSTGCNPNVAGLSCLSRWGVQAPPNERDVSRYLVFTEGYFSEKDEPHIRRALREAI